MILYFFFPDFVKIYPKAKKDGPLSAFSLRILFMLYYRLTIFLRFSYILTESFLIPLYIRKEKKILPSHIPYFLDFLPNIV